MIGLEAHDGNGTNSHGRGACEKGFGDVLPRPCVGGQTGHHGETKVAIHEQGGSQETRHPKSKDVALEHDPRQQVHAHDAIDVVRSVAFPQSNISIGRSRPSIHDTPIESRKHQHGGREQEILDRHTSPVPHFRLHRRQVPGTVWLVEESALSREPCRPRQGTSVFSIDRSAYLVTAGLISIYLQQQV
jgi:hypothetical protein